MNSPLGSLHDERMELLAEVKRERDFGQSAWWKQKKPVRSAVEERKAAKLADFQRRMVLGI